MPPCAAFFILMREPTAYEIINGEMCLHTLPGLLNLPTRRPFFYLRKSHLVNADNDLDVHERRAYAKMQAHGEANPIIIKEPEGHRSAQSDKDRPGYRWIEELTTADKIKTLYINDRARIWRDDIEFMLFLVLAKRHNTKIVPSIEEPIGDIENDEERLLEFLRGWANKKYPSAVSKSLRATKADLRKAGKYVANRPPMGLSLVGSKFERRLEANADLPIIVEALELYVSGHGCDGVARLMNARGHKWHYGQQWLTFGGQSLLRLIRGIELFQPFLDPLLYERVIETRAQRRNRQMNSARHKHPRLLLSKLLYCGHCGKRFYSNYHLKRPRGMVVYPSYLHPEHVACPTPRRWYGAGPIEDQAWAQLAAYQHLILGQQDLLTRRLLDMQPDESALHDFIAQKERLAKELLMLRRNYNRGDFGDTDNPAVLEFFRGEQARLEKELTELQEPPAPAPHKHLTLKQVELFADMPLDALRANAAVDSDKANRWIATLIDRAELCDGVLQLKLHPELARLLDNP